MRHKTSIALLMPTYNRLHVINRAITAAVMNSARLPNDVRIVLLILDDSTRGPTIRCAKDIVSEESMEVVIQKSAKWLPPNLKINALMSRPEAAACDYFALWDDDDYHLPNRLSDLLAHIETNKVSSAIHKQHYLVSGQPHNMSISLTERPHPNSGLYHRSLWKPLDDNDTVGYDQTLFYRAGCDRYEHQHKGIGLAYFWGGTYHNSASADAKRAEWATEHNRMFPSDSVFHLDIDPEAMAALYLLQHIAANNAVAPNITTKLQCDSRFSCPACAGSGQDYRWANSLLGPKTKQQLPCPACAGQGTITKSK